jgi:two-component system response regulator HydG
VNELQRELHQRHDLRNLVAESPRMRALVTAVERVAGRAEPVLLLGEPGSGRRFLARAVHFSGPRRRAPFELLDCESPPREGLERCLFGHVSEGGRPRQGQLERLAGGTLHIHRLEACPRELQRKLAKVLASGEVRTGYDPPRALETRLVLSPGEPRGGLEALFADGRLIEELECLRGLTTLELPPLRERAQDLPGLVQAFCEQYEIDHGRRLEITPEARASLEEGDFPCNVRQLFRLLGHAATMALDGELSSELLQRARRQAGGVAGTGRPIAADLGDREYQLVLGAVQRNPGRLDEAARELGVSRTTLWRRMRKYDIKV